jgi:hypothetical protein
MAKLAGAIAAFLIFFGWIRLVGNPHVVETVIGLVIAVVAGLFIFSKFR